MAKMINEQNLSLGWLTAVEHLLECGGKDVNLVVTIRDTNEEDSGIRQSLDRFIATRREKVVSLSTRREKVVSLSPISTVANTIFPQALYHPELGNRAQQHLYQSYEQGYTVSSRLRANCYGTYFHRMIAWPGQPGEINQLERLITRLKRQLQGSASLSSIYELATSEVEEAIEEASSTIEETAEIKIYLPECDSGRIRGFPCLSHISLTLFEKRLHLTAVYRNQHFLRKAYGNYLGLSRLLHFICQEASCQPGELMCIATHADMELGSAPGCGKRDIIALVRECRAGTKRIPLPGTFA